MTDQTEHYHERRTAAVRIKQLAVAVFLVLLCLVVVLQLPDFIASLPQTLLRVFVVGSYAATLAMLLSDSEALNTIGRYMASILAIATALAALKWVVITAP